MNKAQSIISNRRISMSFVDEIFTRGIYLMLFVLSIWGFYRQYTKGSSENDQELLGYFALSVMAVFSVTMLFVSRSKQKVTFYSDNRSIETKEKVVDELKTINRWKLVSSEKNYYLFYENNGLFSSYYITIVFDDAGFFLNCYPSSIRLDLGGSQSWCDELYESIKNTLNSSEWTGKDFEFLITGETDIPDDQFISIMTPKSFEWEVYDRDGWAHYRVGEDEYTFSVEPPGLQMTFNPSIKFEKAKKIADEIIENIKASGREVELLTLDKSKIYKLF